MTAALKLQTDVPQLPPGRMKSDEFVRTIWVVTTEEGIDRKTLLNPNFWSHAAQRLRPYDRVEVRCDSQEYYAEYLVLNVGTGFAHVKELSFYKLTEDETKDASEDNKEYEVKNKGPQLKFCVIRVSDSQVLAEGMKKADAEIWKTEYIKTIQ